MKSDAARAKLDSKLQKLVAKGSTKRIFVYATVKPGSAADVASLMRNGHVAAAGDISMVIGSLRANEATKLASVLERASKLGELAGKPTDFSQWMDESVRESAALRDAIQQWRDGKATAEAVEQSYKDLSATCNACHEVYRNE